MNRTIKEAAVKGFNYDNHEQVRNHLANVISAYKVRIPEHAPTHSDNMRPLVPGYPPTSDALP